MIEVIKRSTRS